MLNKKLLQLLLNTFLSLLFLFFPFVQCCPSENTLFWWHNDQVEHRNFGDELSQVIVEKILGNPVTLASLKEKKKTLFAVGSILHYARNEDVILGSGFRETPLLEKRFNKLDVRAVRGPRTRDFLLQMGIDCPAVYGDPAVLMGHLFPEFKKEAPLYDYIIIPNIGEIKGFLPYRNVVLPTEPWDVIVKKMMKSRLVISSSLHGIIVAESFGIPARLLKMTMIEKLLKYQDYYESTGRPNFQYATSVQEALKMGAEPFGTFDIMPLLDSFPYDYFNTES
jgi:pyruvyltransferase